MRMAIVRIRLRHFRSDAIAVAPLGIAPIGRVWLGYNHVPEMSRYNLAIRLVLAPGLHGRNGVANIAGHCGSLWSSLDVLGGAHLCKKIRDLALEGAALAGERLRERPPLVRGRAGLAGRAAWGRRLGRHVGREFA